MIVAEQNLQRLTVNPSGATARLLSGTEPPDDIEERGLSYLNTFEGAIGWGTKAPMGNP